MKTLYLLCAIGLLILAGCGGSEGPPGARTSTSSQAPPHDGASDDGEGMMGPKGRAAQMGEEAPAQMALLNKQDQGEEKAKQPNNGKRDGAQLLPRKIVQTAELQIIVEDFDQAERGLRQLIKEHKDCYVAQADISGSSGSPRRGHWKIRVPVAEFEEFVEAIVTLGVPREHKVDSKDVTEEYYDLQARIKNKKTEEERLLKHLEKSTGKLEEILTVEREISRVRGEVEQLEGRLRMLANLTALTTVSLTIQEIKNYVPPQTPPAPTFSSRVGGTFSGSLDVFVTFCQSLILIAVALAPWLPVVVVVGAPAWWLVRRSFRRTVAPSRPVAS